MKKPQYKDKGYFIIVNSLNAKECCVTYNKS